MEFLRAALAGDPVPATEIGRRAHEHGLTAAVVRSAREALGVKIKRNGFGPGSRSLWSLPPTIDGYEVIGLEPDETCTYCGQRGDDPVYLMQGLFKLVGREPLHEACAAYWYAWYSAIRRGGRV